MWSNSTVERDAVVGRRAAAAREQGPRPAADGPGRRGFRERGCRAAAQVVVRQLFWLEIRVVRVRAAVRREDAGLEPRPGEDVA